MISITMGQVLSHLQDYLWKETKQTKQSTMLDYFEHINYNIIQDVVILK